ncbi:MAG: hypothetical protein ABI946_08865 [Chthoniobacterales bacterium]
MKKLARFGAVMAAAFLTMPLLGDTMSVPNAEKPAFTFDVPADWHPKGDADDESAEATSPDKHVYISSWIVSGSEMKDLEKDIEKTLADSMGKVDPEHKEETMQLNGIDFTLIKGTGTDKREGNKVKFQVALFPAGGDKVGIFYADYDADAPADTTDTLQGIIKSIKVTK